jgi:hypothetical protein
LPCTVAKRLVQGRRQPAPHCREASGAGDIVSLFYFKNY